MKTLLGVECLLACDATAHIGHRLATGLGYQYAALLAIGPPGAAGERLARMFDRIGDALIDLVLYRAIARPTTCHDLSSQRQLTS